jgi:hypothetical protein
LGQAPLDLQKNARAAVLHEIDDMLETCITSIIGIRHFAIRVFGAKFAEMADFAVVLALRVQGKKVPSVLIIHDKDEIIFGQVFRVDLTGDVGEIVTPLGTRFPHARIGMLPYMPASRACGVDVNFVQQASLLYQAIHDTIGSR